MCARVSAVGPYHILHGGDELDLELHTPLFLASASQPFTLGRRLRHWTRPMLRAR
jgi:hypothetical protein